MKNIIRALVTLCCIVTIGFTTSCTKDDTMEFTNLSGKDFYGCVIWFWNSEDSSDGAIGFEDAGNVKMGETGKVKKLGEYCSVNAKDANGDYVMSKIEPAFDGMSFSKYDLY